jgi:hypothetical protein
MKSIDNETLYFSINEEAKNIILDEAHDENKLTMEEVSERLREFNISYLTWVKDNERGVHFMGPHSISKKTITSAVNFED